MGRRYRDIRERYGERRSVIERVVRDIERGFRLMKRTDEGKNHKMNTESRYGGAGEPRS